MSTRSLLYHAFGLATVEPMKTTYLSGAVQMHVRTPRDRLVCPLCRGPNVLRRGECISRLRSVPIGARRCFIIAHLARVQCRDCGAIRQEQVAWKQPYRRYTTAFARYVLELCRIATVADVARHLGCSWDLVRQIQEEDLRRQVAKRDLGSLRRLAVDELAIGKGHRYVAVVMDLDSGAVVHVGDGKGAGAIDGFFRRLAQRGVTLQAVAMDMSGAWQLAVKTHFPDAAIVFDHFHLVKLMNDKLSKLRRQVQNAADTAGKKAIKGSRWILLKAPENLSEERDEHIRLQAALELNKPLATGYYLKEELRQLYRQENRAAAASLLDDWCTRADKSGIGILCDMAATLRRHRDGILAYYTHRISTGPLEGFNNKAQTMKRQAYGYRNIDFYKLKLMTLHTKTYALTG